MKLDVLCELDLMSGTIEYAAIEPFNLRRIGKEEEIEDRVYDCITSLDDAIHMLNKYFEAEKYFETRFYYELMSNVLESKEPQKIITFYEERLKEIMQRIEDDPDNLKQTEFIVSDLQKAYDKGIISEQAKKDIEQKRRKLTVLWLDLFEGLYTDLQSIKEGKAKPKRERARQYKKEQETPYLTDREIDIISKLPEYFKYDGEKWQFLKRHGKGLHWRACGFIFGRIHGAQYDAEKQRIKKYFNATWSDKPETATTDIGETRENNWQTHILNKYDSIAK